MYETQTPHEMMGARVMAYRMQYTTVQLDITKCIFDELYLVQKIYDLHVQNIKTLLKANPENFAAPFLLEVDPRECPTKADWDENSDVHRTWRYRILGGNHGARAKLDLWQTYGKSYYKTLQAWVYARLSHDCRKYLAWAYNVDQEYKKGMRNIDQIRACHSNQRIH
jgi:hypothetical protein